MRRSPQRAFVHEFGDGPGGTWRYAAWRPPALQRWVDHIWAFEGPTVNVGKRIFPNGRLELVVNLAEPYRAADGAAMAPVNLTGNRATPLVILQPRRQNVIGARLYPAGARALMSAPVADVTEDSVDVGDLLGDRATAAELMEAAAVAPDIGGRMRVVARWLAARLRRSASASAPIPIARAVDVLDRSGGAVSVVALRNACGLSKRAFVEGFRAHVGLAPKAYARVARFHRALSALQAGGARSLADLACDLGFYDQPHMNAEFRALGGVTPRAFVKSRHPVGDGSTAAEDFFSKTGAGAD